MGWIDDLWDVSSHTTTSYASKFRKSRFSHEKCRRSWAGWGHHRGQEGDGDFLLCPAKLPNETRSVASSVSVPDRHRPASPNLPPIRSPESASNAYTSPFTLPLDLSTCSVCLRLSCPIYQNLTRSLHDCSAGLPIHHRPLLSLWRPPSPMLVTVLELQALPPTWFYLDAQLS